MEVIIIRLMRAAWSRFTDEERRFIYFTNSFAIVTDEYVLTFSLLNDEISQRDLQKVEQPTN